MILPQINLVSGANFWFELRVRYLLLRAGKYVEWPTAASTAALEGIRIGLVSEACTGSSRWR